MNLLDIEDRLRKMGLTNEGVETMLRLIAEFGSDQYHDGYADAKRDAGDYGNN